MPNLFRYIFLFLFSTTLSVAQPQPLPSTPSWSFVSDTYNYSGKLEVQIFNNNKGGTLKLNLKVSDTTFYIGGNVYLFLEDGNVITCTDKNIRSISGTIIQSSYFITPNEIALLKKQPITDIRFRIIGDQTTFSSPTGYFTAQNKIRRFGLPDKAYATAIDINQLFP
jgi:hypothetical protein